MSLKPLLRTSLENCLQHRQRLFADFQDWHRHLYFWKHISVFDLSALIPSSGYFLLIHLNHHFIIVILGRSITFLKKQFLFQIFTRDFRIYWTRLIFHVILIFWCHYYVFARLISTNRDNRCFFKLFYVLIFKSLLRVTFMNFIILALLKVRTFANLQRLRWIPDKVLLNVNLKVLMVLNGFVGNRYFIYWVYWVFDLSEVFVWS
jgi:hypothetical protein